MNILHISDLHISKDNIHRIKDITSALIKDVSFFADKIDLVIFTGDLINCGGKGLEDEYQYDYAKDNFIRPIMDAFSVDNSRFIIIPGNHDIDRSKVNSLKIESPREYKELYDKLSFSVEHLSEFDIFKELFYEDSHNITKSKLWYSFRNNIEGITIGIACLYSVFNCCGDSTKDYGQLFMLDRIIDEAYQSINDCDIKIAAFHHPCEFLLEEDRNDVENKLINFDIIMNGHLHKSRAFSINPTEEKHQISIRCGSINKNERHFNVYNFINYNNDSKVFTIYFREYYPDRNIFDASLQLIKEGKRCFSFGLNDDNSLEFQNRQIILSIKDTVINSINDSLITSLCINTSAPKDLERIFISPIISDTPITHSKADMPIFDFYDIIAEQKNCILSGKKEYGKTTALQYICMFYLINFDIHHKIPVIIDYEFIINNKGKNLFIRAIADYFSKYDQTGINIHENLKKGNFVFLVDNFNQDDPRKVKFINEINEDYPNNLFVFTVNETILNDMQIEKDNFLEVTCDKYYIHPMNRHKVRELTEKWMSNIKNVDISAIIEAVMRTISLTNVAINPFNVSIILWIIERQQSKFIINEAKLIDRFINSILEKINPNEVVYGGIDFEDKQTFIAYLAGYLVEKNLVKVKYEEAISVIDSLTSSYGLGFYGERIIDEMIEKGIMVDNFGIIYFRFNCFFEYYTAKYMQENEEFKEFILKEDNYLKYSKEIVYYSGLNKKELGLIELLSERLHNEFSKIDKYITLSSSLTINDKLFRSRVYKLDKSIDDLLLETELTVEERDEIQNIAVSDEQVDKKISERNVDYKDDLLSNLILFCNVLRNIEHISLDDKKQFLKDSIEKYIQLATLFVIVLHYKEEKNKESLDISDVENDGESDEEDENESANELIQYLLTIGVTMVLQFVFHESIGSPKLSDAITELYEESDNELESYFLVSLYADLKLHGYIDLLDGFYRKRVKSVFIKENMFYKLLYYHGMHSIIKRDVDTLQNLITDIKIELNSLDPQRVKSIETRTLKDKRIISQFKGKVENTKK